MDILPIAASSLSAAGTTAAVRANNIVNVLTPGFTAAAPVSGSIPTGGVAVFAQETGQPVNLALEIVGLESALNQYKAAANLVQVGTDMNKALLAAFA
ncbi:MAG: hypothetical protein SFV21_10695 [Rhodospirillaceae bacterium]|nr:hypothetical protein [Rhodospirillaceae bacterium]